ncbi:TIGR04222 domain-containing membrane protein [Streptomyces fradiae]|uniref:TIGR04222 domain-containing membrane protein n=1 Tax=Streptomyces fradiae TaxID=1906 RepID=UPI0035129245
MNTIAFLYYLFFTPFAAVLVAKLRRIRRTPPGGVAVHDRYETAFLNGGPARVADTAITALHADGRLMVGGPGIVQVLRPTAYDPVERAVLQELSSALTAALGPLRFAVMRHPAVQEIGDGLAARGLILQPRACRSAGVWGAFVGMFCGMATLFALMFSLPDLVGFGPRQVPFVLKVLPVLAVTLTAAVMCAVAGKRRVTPAGRAAVDAFARSQAVADPALLVTLQGLPGLPDPVLRDQLATTARSYRPAPPPRRSAAHHHHPSTSSSSSDAALLPVMWCAAAAGGEGGGCGGGGSSCSSGSSCSGGGGVSGCSSSSGSSCSSSSGSSCSSSSGSSCGSSS